MADYSDGSIVIDTELDTSDIESSIDNTRKKLTGLSGQFKELGRTIGTAFQRFTPVFQSIGAEAARAIGTAVTQTAAAYRQQSSAAQSLASDLDKLESSAQKGFSNGSAVLRFKDQIDSAERKVEALKAEMESLGGQRIPTEEYRAFTSSLEAAEDEMGKLLARKVQMESVGTSKTSQAWKRLQYDIQNARLEIDACHDKMAELEASGTAFMPGTDTAEYRQMAELLDRANNQLDRNKVLIDAEKLAQAQLNVQAAQEAVIAAKTAKERERALSGLRTAQEALKATAAQSSASPGQNFKVPRPDKSHTDAWKKFGDTIGKAMKTAQKTTFSRLTAGLKSLRRHAGNATLSAGSLVKALTSLKTMLLSRLKRMFISSIFNEAKEGIGKLAQFSTEFDNTMSNLKNRAKELSSNLSVTIGNAISAIEPILTPIIEALSRLVTYLNSFFAMLQGKSTVTVAKRQTDSYAESLDSAAESAKELKAQVYGFDELNKASSTKDSTKEKTGADLFETKDISDVVPSGLLEALTKIKDALLAGEWREAGKLIAEGLNSVVQTVDDFITGTLRPKGKEWAANIAELFNGITDGLNWETIGKTIGDGINAIADTVNTFLTRFEWDNLGKGFGRSINGLFDAVEWNLLGETFANKWNALISFIHGIVTTVKWDVVGDKAAEFVQSFADRFDLHTLAETVSAGLNGLVTLLQHFLDGVRWEDNAKKLASGINTVFSGVNWSGIGKLLSDGVKTALSFLSTTISNTNWKAIGTDISTAINAFDWENILGNAGKLVSNAVKGLFDLLIGYLEGLNWWETGEKIYDGLMSAVTNLDLSGIASRLFELLGASIGASIAGQLSTGKKFWTSLMDGINSTKSYFDAEIEAAGGNVWEGIKNGLVKAVKSSISWLAENVWDPFQKGLLTTLGYKDWGECGRAIYEGILKPIGEFFSNIGSWIKEHIFDPFVNWFKKLFGINSPSTVMAELGKYLVQGLHEGITGAWGAVTGFFTKALPELKTSLLGKWKEMLSDANTKWGEIRTKITTAFDGVKTNLSKAGETMKTNMGTTWGKISSTLTGTLSTMYTTATGKIETLKTELTRKWETLKSNFDRTNWNSTGENLVSGLQSGIERSWDGLTRSVRTLADGLTRTIKGVFEINSPSRVWSEVGAYLDKGLQEGILAEENTVLHTVAAIARNINSSLQIDPPEIGDIETITLKGVDVSALSTLDRLNLQFDGLIDRLTAVQNLLTGIGGFTPPTMATGTLIPYQAQSQSYTVRENFEEQVNLRLSNFEELLDEYNSKIDRLIEVVRGKNLSLDAGVLSETVTRMQKKHEIDYGGF